MKNYALMIAVLTLGFVPHLAVAQQAATDSRVPQANPLLQNQEAPPSCAVRNVPPKGVSFHGKVVGAAPVAEVKKQTEMSEKTAHGYTSPDFTRMPRVTVDFVDEEGHSHRAIAVVRQGKVPPAGMEIDVLSRFVDPRNPCYFIPLTVATAYYDKHALLDTKKPTGNNVSTLAANDR
jgi:hypothetical protein